MPSIVIQTLVSNITVRFSKGMPFRASNTVIQVPSGHGIEYAGRLLAVAKEYLGPINNQFKACELPRLRINGRGQASPDVLLREFRIELPYGGI